MILGLGTLAASLLGTTGAAMLLIRPLIRANQDRRHKTHVFVFFIFLVGNIGGSLTPLGDPPLFLGFLHGIDFSWTLRAMAMPMGLSAGSSPARLLRAGPVALAPRTLDRDEPRATTHHDRWPA